MGPVTINARLIPAHAGKTRRDVRPGNRRTAHPRSRGENNAQSVAAATGKGSSPLTRGKPASSPRTRSPTGLIPAHAGKTHYPERNSHEPWAHPRSRGENPELWSASILENGSSPLTRGKLTHGDASAKQIRLIPAHAGKTSGVPFCAMGASAHPRSRGENRLRCVWAMAVVGSSPLTRGKPTVLRLCRGGRRLIPAHAGKTKGALQYARHTAAHPRSRGENTS